MTWPYPGDSPLARARRVAHAYRAALFVASPEQCAMLDAIMASWEQYWVVPRIVTRDPTEWIPAVEAAELSFVHMAQVRQWRRRGLLDGRKVDGKWMYLTADVLALASSPRHRAIPEIEDIE